MQPLATPTNSTILALQAAGLAPANLAERLAATTARLEAAQRQAMRDLFGSASTLTLADYRCLCAVKLRRANSVRYGARLGSKASFAALLAAGYLVLADGLYTPTAKSNA